MQNITLAAAGLLAASQVSFAAALAPTPGSQKARESCQIIPVRHGGGGGGGISHGAMLQANARLNVAYLLREQFEQLWSYTDPADARSFSGNWQHCRDRTWLLTKSSPA